MNEAFMIAAMAIATFAIRYGLFAISSRIVLSPTVLRALRYVPPVVLTAIVIPEVLLHDGALHLTLANARLVGAIAAGVVGSLTHNLLLTIVLGMAVFWGWQGFMS